MAAPGGRAILEQWKIFRTTLRKRQRQRVGLGGDEDNETARAASSAMAKQGATKAKSGYGSSQAS